MPWVGRAVSIPLMASTRLVQRAHFGCRPVNLLVASRRWRGQGGLCGLAEPSRRGRREIRLCVAPAGSVADSAKNMIFPSSPGTPASMTPDRGRDAWRRVTWFVMRDDSKRRTALRRPRGLVPWGTPRRPGELHKGRHGASRRNCGGGKGCRRTPPCLTTSRARGLHAKYCDHGPRAGFLQSGRMDYAVGQSL